MKKILFPLIAIFALAAPIATAQAAPLERENYSGTDTFDFDDCGYVIHGEATFNGTFMLKAPRGDGAAPLVFDNYEVHEVLTANDRTLYIDHQGLFKEQKATLVEGTTYRFFAMEAGQPFVVSDADGNVLIRDRGVLKMTYLVDTQGDTDPENDVFIEDSFELLADHGRHPGFYLDFCEAATEYFFD